MQNHHLTMFKIKSELFDLWTENITLHSYEEWFLLLKPLLKSHFDIVSSDFLIYVDNSFHPLRWHKSSTADQAIPLSIAEGARKENNQTSLRFIRKKGFTYVDDVIIFRGKDHNPLGLLLISSTQKWHEFSKSSYIDIFEKVFSDHILIVKKLVKLVNQEEKYRQLYTVTELFNATMASHVVLEGIMHAIGTSFPELKAELLLAHEQQGVKPGPYRMFDYMNERPSAIDAFVSGEFRTEVATDLRAKLVNVPIKGRQGIYGIIQVMAPIDYLFSKSQQNFIQTLANTAGSSLENASLYEQSSKLIEELQLVNETSRMLNGQMQIEEMVAYLKGQLKKTFHPEEIGLILYDQQNELQISQFSTELFHSEMGLDYIDYAHAHFTKVKEPLFDACFSATVKQPVRYESLIAIPVMVQEKIMGFVICLHRKQYFFSFDSFKLMKSLISHSALALANSMLRDQLQDLVDKDYVTKLYARSYLDHAISASLEKDDSGSLIMIDIDNFKVVNDSYGHETGDNVLIQIARHILKEVKDRGIGARWGGEELAIYLPNTNLREARTFAERLVMDIPSITNPSVTISAGVSSWSHHERKAFKELFRHTDDALYAAKNNGKNQVIVYEAPSAFA